MHGLTQVTQRDSSTSVRFPVSVPVDASEHTWRTGATAQPATPHRVICRLASSDSVASGTAACTIFITTQTVQRNATIATIT